jgi:hypothetical protein
MPGAKTVAHFEIVIQTRNTSPTVNSLRGLKQAQAETIEIA